MTKINITATAYQDLIGILDYIALDSETIALKFVDELQAKTKKVLELFPNSGSPYVGGSRYLVICGRVIIYEYDETADEVYVTHIKSPGQDWH